VESHRIKPDEIKFIDNYEVFDVREDVVSLLRLNRLFNIASEEEGEYNFVVAPPGQVYKFSGYRRGYYPGGWYCIAHYRCQPAS
jgi:hypothetical protein